MSDETNGSSSGRTKSVLTRLGGVAVVALGVAVALWWSRVDAQTGGPSEERASVPPLEVMTVEPTETRSAQVYHGVVQPRRRALLSFTDGGRLDARPAEIGDRVEPGQVLARLDGRGYRNALSAARANDRELALRSEQLARDRERSERLRREGVTTDSTLEQVSSGYDRVMAMRAAARANLAESQRRRGEAVLRAPFAGVVTDVLVEPGELVQPGQPILRLAGDGGHEVVLQVHAELARGLRPGTELALSAVGLEAEDPLARRPLRGTLRSVVTESAGLEGLFPVVVDVAPDEALRAGLGVEAQLFGEPHAALRVPLAAILDPSGRRPFVWKVVDGRAERAWLRLGRLSDGWVEVLEGLEEGDRVVVRGHTRLLPGDAVGGAS